MGERHVLKEGRSGGMRGVIIRECERVSRV